MTALDFHRHCAEIVAQATSLAAHLDDVDVTVPVPSCPGWNVSQLCRHVDGGLRWATEIVATRAAAPPSDLALRDLSEPPTATPPRSRRRCGTPPTDWSPPWTRRVLPHRCGARCRVVVRRSTRGGSPRDGDPPRRRGARAGIPFVLDRDVARDGVDEWLELGCMPYHFDVHPWMRELLGPGRVIGLHATDSDDALGARPHR